MEETFKIHNMKFSGKKRYYIEDLSERDFTLENTVPFSFKIDDYYIEANNWGDVICELGSYCYKKYPKDESELLSFRTIWTKSAIYYSYKDRKVNSKPISKYLYINCNHTAVHSCWLIQDLMNFYDIDLSRVELVIHRPPSSEPADVKALIQSKMKATFKDYLKIKYKKDEESANKITDNISTRLNKWLAECSPSYNDFFLFDNYPIFYNMSIKTIEKIRSSYGMPEKNIRIYEKYIKYLTDFYKEIGIK